MSWSFISDWRPRTAWWPQPTSRQPTPLAKPCGYDELKLSFTRFLPSLTGWGTVIHRILVATDRSDTATKAVEWAAEMSGRYGADLLVLQVIAPEHLTGQDADGAAADQLAALTREVCGERGRPLLVYDSDPAGAIVRTCEEERVDLVVVGNVGMRDRTEFLLGSVPNQVSHNARCSV